MAHNETGQRDLHNLTNPIVTEFIQDIYRKNKDNHSYHSIMYAVMQSANM